jgi:hypothetical protein
MKRTEISLLFFLAAGIVTLASPALAEDAIPLTRLYTRITRTEN